MNRGNLEDKAEKTLRDTDTYRVPVPIDVVAQRLNLTMKTAATRVASSVASLASSNTIRRANQK
jgi:hypothetical protein